MKASKFTASLIAVAPLLLHAADEPQSKTTGASDQFFTPSTLGTLAGASGITLIITNAFKTAFDFNPRWLGLVVAEILSCGAAYFFAEQPIKGKYFIAVLNGFLIYMTAMGGSHLIGGGGPGAGGGGPVTGKSSRTFWSKW